MTFCLGQVRGKVKDPAVSFDGCLVTVILKSSAVIGQLLGVITDLLLQTRHRLNTATGERVSELQGLNEQAGALGEV